MSTEATAEQQLLSYSCSAAQLLLCPATATAEQQQLSTQAAEQKHRTQKHRSKEAYTLSAGKALASMHLLECQNAESLHEMKPVFTGPVREERLALARNG